MVLELSVYSGRTHEGVVPVRFFLGKHPESFSGLKCVHSFEAPEAFKRDLARLDLSFTHHEADTGNLVPIGSIDYLIEGSEALVKNYQPKQDLRAVLGIKAAKGLASLLEGKALEHLRDEHEVKQVVLATTPSLARLKQLVRANLLEFNGRESELFKSVRENRSEKHLELLRVLGESNKLPLHVNIKRAIELLHADSRAMQSRLI